MLSTPKQRKLILHFDVNKTIIMKDSSKPLHSVEHTVSNSVNLTCNRSLHLWLMLHGANFQMTKMNGHWLMKPFKRQNLQRISFLTGMMNGNHNQQISIGNSLMKCIIDSLRNILRMQTRKRKPTNRIRRVSIYRCLLLIIGLSETKRLRSLLRKDSLVRN